MKFITKEENDLSDGINENNIHENEEIMSADEKEVTTDEVLEETGTSDDIIEQNEEELPNETPTDAETKNNTEHTYRRNILSRIIYRILEYIEFLKNTEPKKRMKIITSVSVCVLVVLLVLTDFIPILPNAYNRFYVGNSYVIGETQGGLYDKLGKDIIYVGNGAVMSFAPDMTCNFKHEISPSSPRLETSGKNAVVYYKNSNEAVIITENENINDIKLTEKITGAAISKKGYYGFVTEEPGYKSCVNIFKPGGASLYKWHTNNPVIDISVSENGRNMAAASYTIENNQMAGKLIFFDMKESEPVKEIVTAGNVISELRYISDDVVIAFGDLYTAAYTSKGVMKWRIDYAGRTLKTYDISPKGELAFVFDRYSSELSESTVELYSTSGRLMGKYESKDNIKYVSANNDCFLLSLDGQTVLLDDDADVMKKRKTEKDYRKAVLYYNYNFGFSVSDSVAEIISVNH